MSCIKVDPQHWVIDKFLVREVDGIKHVKNFSISGKWMDLYTRHKVTLLNVIDTKVLADKYPNTLLIPCQSEFIFQHVQTPL